MNEEPQAATATRADEQQLGYLSLGYFIYAAFNAVCACMPGISIFLGLAMIVGSHDGDEQFGGAVLAGTGIFAILLMLLYSALMALCGFLIARRSGRPIVIGLAILTALNMPFGTILGVLTLIVILRDSVTALFDRQS